MMVEFLRKLFGKRSQSPAQVAKVRLMSVVIGDNFPPQLLESLRGEMISLLKKYLEIDESHIEINLDRNNGKPSMLVFDITGQDFENLIDTLNRAEAMRLLEDIQMQALRGGLNSMTMDEIDAEIFAKRRGKKDI